MRASPGESRRDLVENARSSTERRKKIAEDFRIFPATLSNWAKADEIENGTNMVSREIKWWSCGSCVALTAC